MSTNHGLESNGFDKDTIVQLKEVFDFLDLDKNGAVTIEEVIL